MFSIRHWKWWNWLLAGILMPLLAGALGLTVLIGLAVIALVARVVLGPAPPWDPELDTPLLRFSRKAPAEFRADDEWHEWYWVGSDNPPGGVGSDFMD